MDKNFATQLIRFVLLSALFPLTAWANPVDCGNKPINLAYFPFGVMYFEQDGQGKGIDKDLVSELTKRTGCQFNTLVLPRARVWADLESGALDMSVSAIQTPERERFAWFAPYATAKNYVLVRRDSARQASNATGFLAQNQLQFGAVRGFKHGLEQDQWLDRLRQQGRVQESTTIDLLFEKLEQGHVDAMFSLPPLFRKLLSDRNMQEQFVIQDWAPGAKGVVGNLILSKHRFSEADALRWQVLIEQIRRDGTLQRIFRQHLSAAEAAEMANF